MTKLSEKQYATLVSAAQSCGIRVVTAALRIAPETLAAVLIGIEQTCITERVRAAIDGGALDDLGPIGTRKGEFLSALQTIFETNPHRIFSTGELAAALARSPAQTSNGLNTLRIRGIIMHAAGYGQWRLKVAAR